MEDKIIVKNANGTSKAWDHFGFYKVENQIFKDKAICKICKQECKYTGGTTNLNQHLLTHHSEIFNTMPSSGVKKSIQAKVTSMMKKPIVEMSSASYRQCAEAIAEFIFGDLVPLATVESKHFQGMVKVLSGGSYEPPKRRYFTDTLLPKMLEETSQQIKNEIASGSGKGLTTDSWTSGFQTENCITYTAHYITKEWKMNCVVLSTQCSEEKHNSENLAVDMKNTEERLGMNNLLFKPVYVHDNAANVTKAPKLLNPPRIGIGCLATKIYLASDSATSIRRVSDILGKAR